MDFGSKEGMGAGFFKYYFGVNPKSLCKFVGGFPMF